jgi:HAE1 family hydrophobic/amphiphilic exporter-1
VSSTTLLLVPTLYTMLELRKERRAKKRAAKKDGPASQPAPAAEEPEPAGV